MLVPSKWILSQLFCSALELCDITKLALFAQPAAFITEGCQRASGVAQVVHPARDRRLPLQSADRGIQ